MGVGVALVVVGFFFDVYFRLLVKSVFFRRSAGFGFVFWSSGIWVYMFYNVLGVYFRNGVGNSFGENDSRCDYGEFRGFFF